MRILIMTKKRLVIVIAGTLTLYRLAHLKKILKIVENLLEQVVVIYEAESDMLYNSRHVEVIRSKPSTLEKKSVSFLKIFGYLLSDLSKLKILIKKSSKHDNVLFLGIYQPSCLAFAKLRGNYIMHFCGGFDIISSFKSKGLSNALLNLKWSFQTAALQLSKKPIFETPGVLSSYNLNKYKKKSFLNGHLFVDLDIFRPVVPFSERTYDLGYIGAMSEEKGILQFVKSLPIIMNTMKAKVAIIGDGHSSGETKAYVSEKGLSAVDFKNVMEYSEMPSLLNDIKILVVPSFSEGLPNVIIEAMACGAVVLATPVGGIPDEIINGKTGFLLSSNDPKEIAQKAIGLLSNINILEAVSLNSRSLVLRDFNLDQTVNNWKDIFRH